MPQHRESAATKTNSSRGIINIMSIRGLTDTYNWHSGEHYSLLQQCTALVIVLNVEEFLCEMFTIFCLFVTVISPTAPYSVEEYLL